MICLLIRKRHLQTAIPRLKKNIHSLEYCIHKYSPTDAAHIGMVTDQKKIDDHFCKLQLYQMHGIAPWDNLIVTYDNKESGVNAKLIKAIIESELL
jgi:hypothetical protein